MDNNAALNQSIDQFNIFHCVECGKCTGACPMAQVDRDFSPRLMAMHAIKEGIHSSYVREKAWNCMTCGLCHERCPIGIPFAEFIRSIRPLYFKESLKGHLSHAGALQRLMRLQAAPMIKQNRLEWITPALRVASRGEILYFAGCLPYFELFFSDLNVQLIEIAIDTVSLLNKIGVEPVVLPDERCCGHDLIWTGDEESFNRLRRLNLQSFHRAGVKTIITACGECSHVLKHLYPNATDSFPFEVMHLSEFLEKNGFPSGKEKGLAATYQDPCRLGRFQQVYEAPRRLLGSVLELREMRHYGRGAWCCGNSSWLSCDRYSKQMQVERLREAKETGSDLLVTACPKCYIHLSCAMRDINRLYDFQFRIQDLASVMSESIDGNSSTEAASSRTGTGKPASYSFNEY